MRVKKYKIKLGGPTICRTIIVSSYQDVVHLFNSLDDLWGHIDFEEWIFTVQPFWEEVPEDGCEELPDNA